MARIFKKAGRYLFLYAAIIALVALMVVRMPSSFVPSEDQGYMLVNLQLPPGATPEQTTSVMKQVEDYSRKQPEVQSMVGVFGFSFSGQGRMRRWRL